MKDIYLFNSLTNKKEKFIPLIDGNISMYVCGPTVYDEPHIGNLRPPIVFDVYYRLFSYLGYKVTYVSNYTDVDDKIINRAKELGVHPLNLSKKYIEVFQNIREKLHVITPTYTPKVSEHIADIIDYISKLIDKGFAYEADGDVYFDVSKIDDYLCLSKMRRDDLISGARIEINDKKRSPLDFALWKKTDEHFNWLSPWSKGRPGWHTECVVFIDKIFASQDGFIDIHGGGFDLKFPHHDNEIAQALAMHGHHLAKYWLHNGFITFGEAEKMSKSLGNVITISACLDKYDANVIRTFILSSSYRAPIAYNDMNLNNAINTFERIKNTYRSLRLRLAFLDIDYHYVPSFDIDEFITALCDDLNTPNAFKAMFDLIKEINTYLHRGLDEVDKLKLYLSKFDTMMNLFGYKVDIPLISKDEKLLYNKYVEAKKNKDFATSDALRSLLVAKGLY